jgi:hypothetical protein
MTSVSVLHARSRATITRSRRIRERARDVAWESRRLRLVSRRDRAISGASDPRSTGSGARRPTALERTADWLSKRHGERYCARCIGKHTGTRRPYLLVAMLEGNPAFMVRHDHCSACQQLRLVVSLRQQPNGARPAQFVDGYDG